MHQPLPAGRYGAILADPPWSFRTYANDNVPPAANDNSKLGEDIDDFIPF
jgi:hypothetical protein